MTEEQAFTYEDRRKDYNKLSSKLKDIHNLRDSVNKLKKDNNDTWFDEQQKLNELIIATEMEIDQIDDSVIEKDLYARVVKHNIKEKDFFKSALEYQESVKERY